MSKVFYGINLLEWIDVTTIAISKCMDSGTLTIPICDPVRAELFEIDPFIGTLKNIFIVDSIGTSTEYDHMTEIVIQNFR